MMATGSQGMGDPGKYQSWYCPYCGRPMEGGMMGSGMMGSGMMRGGMMGPGMMGRDMMGPGMMSRGWGYPYQGRVTPIDLAGAQKMVERYVAATGNPRLEVGKITEKDTAFEAEIVTKDGSLVDKILIDKTTGWMRPAD